MEIVRRKYVWGSKLISERLLRDVQTIEIRKQTFEHAKIGTLDSS